MIHLVPCPGCQRHVRTSEPECPFCGVGLELANSPPPVLPTTRLGRAATFAFGATLLGASSVVSCGGESESHDDDSGGHAGTSVAGNTSGGTANGGTTSSGGTDAIGGGMALYGAPPVGGTTGAGGTVGGTTGSGGGVIYGAPPDAGTTGGVGGAGGTGMNQGGTGGNVAPPYGIPPDLDGGTPGPVYGAAP